MRRQPAMEGEVSGGGHRGAEWQADQAEVQLWGASQPLEEHVPQAAPDPVQLEVWGDQDMEGSLQNRKKIIL